MFLITSADENSWKEDEKILFLGEWCKKYSRRHVWSKFDYEVLPYHWVDREKLHRDYLYLNDLYERTLVQLTTKLNNIHNLNKTSRYWRIIIGPWLSHFIGVFYDSYLSIVVAFNSGLVTNTWISPGLQLSYIPKDYMDFYGFALFDDTYRHHLYAEIIKGTGRISYETLDQNHNLKRKINRRRFSASTAARCLMKKILNIYVRLAPNSLNQIVIADRFTDVMSLIRLQMSLKQIPYPYLPVVEVGQSIINVEMRKDLNIHFGNNEFESLFGKIIPGQIPVAYLERYSYVNKESLRVFPKDPKVIFTTNALYGNEGLKTWVASNVEKGAKLVVGQHGGGYGCHHWSAIEKHETSICDRFFTWGWSEGVQSQTTPISSPKLQFSQGRIKADPTGGILLISVSVSRYFNWMLSMFFGPSTLEYFKDIERFVNGASSEVKNLLSLRLFPHEYGWEEKERWAHSVPFLKVCQGTKSIDKQLNNSRLCIVTYNSTVFLETLCANFPTILFWDPNYWELRDSAQPFFDDLRRAGILFDDPESAIAKVNEIYSDPMSWWMSGNVQEARKKFCDNFARTSDSWIVEWKRELCRIAEK